MEKIIKNLKEYKEHKKKLRAFKSYHHDIIFNYDISEKTGDLPSSRCDKITLSGSKAYKRIYKELLNLIKTHYIAILDNEVFVTVHSIGDRGGCTRYAEKWSESNHIKVNDTKFTFTLEDLIDYKHIGNVKEIIDYLYISNRFKTEEELYEEQKRHEEWVHKLENGRHITRHVADDGYTVIKVYKGICEKCGAEIEQEFHNTPVCKNCGTEVELNFFDKIETVVTDKPQGTATDYILRDRYLKDE